MRGIQRVDEEASPSNLIGDVRLAGLAAALLATFGMASAQQPPAADTSARAGVSERVMRDAESPMRWIKMHSETLRRSEESRKAVAAVAAAMAASASATPPIAAAPNPAPAPNPNRTATAKAAAAKPQHVAMAAPTATAPVVPATIAAAAPSTPAHADSANDERALVTVDRAEPEWDEDLIRRLRKGRVVVRFNVAEDGYLSRIQIVESTNSRLTGPAMAAVMQWRFEPITEPRVATVEFGFDVDSGRH